MAANIIKQQEFMLQKTIEYMTLHGMLIFTDPEHHNIVYLEGVNVDGTENDDAPDKWNDLRMVFGFTPCGVPEIRHLATATTEPGRYSTNSEAARKRGGVARIAFGQYTAWQQGYHKPSKYGKNHPALRQVKPITIHRDKNRDMIRTGDRVYIGQFYIHQHGTRPGWSGENVINFSEGCLVGWNWDQHIEFIELTKTDYRYQQNPEFIYTTAILPGDKVFKKDIINA